MIRNAADVPLGSNPGTLPNPTGAMLSWMRPLTFTRVTKDIVNYNLVETEEEFTMQGVRQPLSAQKLALKPEGQRAWKWDMIHALPDVVLNVDEVIKFDDVKYRVMEVFDWNEYGYREYHIVRDYEGVT